MPFVVDASATLPWCFEDEATPWSESLLDRISLGEQAIAPAHWPIEVSNALLMAARRKRITPDQAEAFLEKLSSLGIRVEPPLSADQIKAAFSLCLTHTLTLTFYDGTYLELAKRIALPLATLDRELAKVAPLERVSLVA